MRSLAARSSICLAVPTGFARAKALHDGRCADLGDAGIGKARRLDSTNGE
jgi:hypothetical protein